MFTINISFKDALRCFETLTLEKPKDERLSIEKEFVKYAMQKAKIGDRAAEAWLRNNNDSGEDFSKVENFISPMSFFTHMKRPLHKDQQLEDLENGIYPDEDDHEYDNITRDGDIHVSLDISQQDRSEEITKVKKVLSSRPLTKRDIQVAMKPLDALVGLTEVKNQLRRILENKIIQERRAKAGLKPIGKISNHMIFTGNPGTGKTTFARLTAKAFKDLGFLSKGHLTEVTRSDLIGEYIGQTEQIVKEVFNKALGGVLFIDEAYTLHKPFSQNDFGHDVISMLLKYMEDHSDNIIVIMAGYPDMMGSFLKSNPGLKSRVPHHMSFENMKEDQLFKVFEDMCLAYEYVLDDKAKLAVKRCLKDMKRLEESEFPNARGVRNLFEDVQRRQAARLLEQNLRTKKHLKLIIEDDIPQTRPVKEGKIIRLPRN